MCSASRFAYVCSLIRVVGGFASLSIEDVVDSLSLSFRPSNLLFSYPVGLGSRTAGRGAMPFFVVYIEDPHHLNGDSI
jgi:hypothetical protein